MDNPDNHQPDGAAGARGRAVILPPEPDDAQADAALVPLRYRFDGWTAARQRGFLAALGETGCIRDACRTVGLSKTSAYRLRAMSGDFAAEWDRALAMAATVLEQVAFQRAVIGVEEEVRCYGKLIGTRRRYSDSLLRLLILRGDTCSGPGTGGTEDRGAIGRGRLIVKRRMSDDEVDAELRRRLDGLRRQLRAQEAEQAVLLLEAGVVP